MKKRTKDPRTREILTAEERSKRMRSVRRSGTTEELLLFDEIVSLGFRPKCNDSSLPGTPDIVFKDRRLAVFVDGDFWHGRDWFSHGVAPMNNRRFWITRFESNRRRDRRCDRGLRQMGWRVMHVWGSDVRRNAKAIAWRIVRRAMKRGGRDA